MEPIIQIKNINVVYDQGMSSETKALDDVSLEIYPREYITIFGPSGCGKSTLLYTIAGIETPTSGGVIVGGKNLSLLSSLELARFHRSDIGMIFQAYNLIPTLNVLNNVALPQVFQGVSRDKRLERAKKLLQRFGLISFISRLTQELSGGQQQRVGIARALINDPLVLLADEPVGNLDSKSAANVMDILQELNENEGRTIILVTHEPQYTHFAHRVFYMKDGKIIREITNPKRKQIMVTPKKKFMSPEYETLARLYPHLSQYRLKAKALANFLLKEEGEEEVDRLEEVVADFLEGKIEKDYFKNLIDRPFSEGGVGFYEPKAKNLTSDISKIIEIIKILKTFDKESEPKSADLKKRFIKDFLLSSSKVTLNNHQIQRLEYAISEVLRNRMTEKHFLEFLDLPYKDGGVGLDVRIAKNFTRLLGVVLINYFE